VDAYVRYGTVSEHAVTRARGLSTGHVRASQRRRTHCHYRLLCRLDSFFGWLYARIIRRAGYSGWWVLMALVPIGNIIMLCFFAFK
jgi:hypothetical protein